MITELVAEKRLEDDDEELNLELEADEDDDKAKSGGLPGGLTKLITSITIYTNEFM